MRYDFLGLMRIGISFLYTKIFFRKAKIIRLPFDVRNKRNIVFGNGFSSGFNCRLETYSEKNVPCMFIGENVQINDYVHITAIDKVEIGNNVLIASKVYISDCSHGSYAGDEYDSNPDTVPSNRPLFTKPVIIENNVWLGEFVSVLPGVTIGKGTIVGANSVVSKDLPPYVIAVGSPAKPIKKFNFDTQKWVKTY
ncbi:Galactoside O-acetyltransferase [Flavobacterium anhuiense]|uniref:Galactoside O-acetyltransferase n=1 Tax=Flavobacterium anhuiense TaxID=459526 RepID=A0AAC9D1Y9_9FLAO|nr:DapH/DapD/GlmU-related protein [Flavobacterium anhuiense]AOC95293.1 Galactoside O-acetyltransferase [Flavobacterium anhuiense]